MTEQLSFLLRPTDSFTSTVEHAQLAEQLGYHSIMCTHIAARDSFTTLGALAQHTERIRLTTNVAPIYHRSPASMAQTAATVDDVSGGRFVLGLGTGHRITMGGWHGQEIGKPVAEMREYVAVVRAILAGEPPPEGERWRSNFGFVGFTPRPDIPIYLAGLSPAMLRLAEKAFFPGRIPFPLLHVDTSYKFPEMIEFRDQYAKQIGAELLVRQNREALDAGANPFALGTQKCCGLLKTKSLLDALAEGGFSPDDIREILLQQAIYCGVPAANHAVKEASAIIEELGLLKG